nr:MAG TPA: hypothetical protein [Caudoviricetes sp.]
MKVIWTREIGEVKITFIRVGNNRSLMMSIGFMADPTLHLHC